MYKGKTLELRCLKRKNVYHITTTIIIHQSSFPPEIFFQYTTTEMHLSEPAVWFFSPFSWFYKNICEHERSSRINYNRTQTGGSYKRKSIQCSWFGCSSDTFDWIIKFSKLLLYDVHFMYSCSLSLCCYMYTQQYNYIYILLVGTICIQNYRNF